MRHRWMALCAFAIAAAGFVAGQGLAQEDGAPAGGMQMPEWTKNVQEHKGLEKFAGEWDVALKFWMIPGQPPTESVGKSSGKMILGGHYLQQDFKGTVMGQPFNGMLLTGFDTVDKEFVAVWVDSFSPVMYVGRGKDVDGTTTYNGSEPDFMTGKKKNTKMTIAWNGDNEYVGKMYDVVEGGEDRQTGEMTYTRRIITPK